MAVTHECTLRTSLPPSHIQLACDGEFLALPYGRTSIGIWNLQDLTIKVKANQSPQLITPITSYASALYFKFLAISPVTLLFYILD